MSTTKTLLSISCALAITHANAGFGNLAELGRALYHDVDLSLERNQSCNACHQIDPATDANGQPLKASGFVDPLNVTLGTPSSLGSVAGKVGAINTPSAAYAMFSPAFHWDEAEGLYVGGQFWNGRAANLSEQAGGPPLNPLEMAMPSKRAVVSRLAEKPEYVAAFKALHGIDLADMALDDAAPANAAAPDQVPAAYQAMTDSIAAFEKTRIFAPFTAKYDFFIAGQTDLTEQERQGLRLWNSDKSQCSACHVAIGIPSPDGRLLPPVFTDFTFDNLGLPDNVNLPGDPPPDLGLGGRADLAAKHPDGELDGKQKVMTIRNIELTAPYMHNGVIKTLEELVHFYNTRDTKPRVCTDNNDPGFGKDCWPEPEVARNVNVDELGDLGLTVEEEAALVAFMLTLTDGYPDWGNDPRVPPGTPSPFADIALPD